MSKLTDNQQRIAALDDAVTSLFFRHYPRRGRSDILPAVCDCDVAIVATGGCLPAGQTVRKKLLTVIQSSERH
ncbi:hypothetical protein PZG14_002410 [Salmonella enterica]|nr:hypothetical protein [Salmonella enterica]